MRKLFIAIMALSISVSAQGIGGKAGVGGKGGFGGGAVAGVTPVVLDNSTSGTFTAQTNWAMPALTVGSGSNRGVVVAVMFNQGASGTITSITGMGATWNGAATIIETSTAARVELWCGINPSTGSQNPTVNFSGSMGDGGGIIVTFSSVSGTTPCQNGAGNINGSNPQSVTVTSNTNDYTVSAGVFNNNNAGGTCTGTGFTQVANTFISTVGVCAGYSTGASTTTMTAHSAATLSAIAGVDVLHN